MNTLQTQSADRVKELLARIRAGQQLGEPKVSHISVPNQSCNQSANTPIINIHKQTQELNNVSNHLDSDNPDFTAELLTLSSNMDIFKSTQSRFISPSELSGQLVSGNDTQDQDNAQQSPILLHTRSKQPAKITLNPKQQAFADLAFTGVDCILIGAAGTGKTTTQKETLEKIISTSGRVPAISYPTKVLRAGLPGIAVVSFTRKAVNNIRRVVPELLRPHTFTIHALLEFRPVFYEVTDKATGLLKTTMRFEPFRNALNPLPEELKLIVFEESSMIGTDLYNLLHAAIQHPVQEIFLGDIQQLPPIFGPAVLGFKMQQLPEQTVELTEVYRQALQSPIIDTLWKILEGNPHAFSSTIEHYDPKTGDITKRDTKSRIRVPALDGLSRETEFGILKFQVWQKNFSIEVALHTAVAQFKEWEKIGYYNPNEDVILCPFNKQFGTVELNRGISNYLSVKRGALVYEIIAGFNKHYLAVGDRVLYDKEDAFIETIVPNPGYLGKAPMPPSVELDRYGVYQRALTEEEVLQAKLEQEATEIMQAEHLFDNVSVDDVEERVNAASHEVVIRIAHSDEILTLRTAGDINALLGGYAITVHKFQGSEADNVFCVFHASHAVMLERELIYTALSRGKRRVHVICENNTFEKAIKRQAIKGNTLAEKAVFFEGKQTKGNDYVVPYRNSGLAKEDTQYWTNFRKRAEVITLAETERVNDTGIENSTTRDGAGTECTEPGDVLDRVKCDQSICTKETDQVQETPAQRASRVLAEIRARKGLK